MATQSIAVNSSEENAETKAFDWDRHRSGLIKKSSLHDLPLILLLSSEVLFSLAIDFFLPPQAIYPPTVRFLFSSEVWVCEYQFICVFGEFMVLCRVMAHIICIIRRVWVLNVISTHCISKRCHILCLRKARKSWEISSSWWWPNIIIILVEFNMKIFTYCAKSVLWIMYPPSACRALFFCLYNI